jgi:Protein of unknown function (DUF3352)
MPKKLLVSLVVVGVLGAAGYWFYAQQASDSPAITTFPPAQALGFFAMPGLPQAWTDVRRSKFYQQVSSPAFWQRMLGQERYQRFVAEKHRLERFLGLPLAEPTINLLLDREFGLALVPSQGRLVDVIVYARVSNTEKVAESLSRMFSRTMQDAVRQTQTVDGFEIVTLHVKDEPTNISYAFLGSLAVLSTDQAWIIDAIKAHQGTAPDRLHTSPAFKAMELEAAESLLAYAYYDVERIQATTLAEVPWFSQTPSATALQKLQTTGEVTLKATRASAGLMIDTMAWYPPRGVIPVFRQVERDGAVPPFRGVPAETFYLTHVDLLSLQGLWQLLTQLAAVRHQEGFQQMLAQFRAWVGVDLERDVLPLFTGVAGLGITAPFGTPPGGAVALPGVFLTFGLTDESKGLKLLQTVVAHAGGPLFSAFMQRRLHDGQTIYYLSNPMLFPNPGYVISRQQLILGSDVGLLQHMLDAASGKTATLTDTNSYQDVRKHFGITGGSITFVDVSAAVKEARDLWAPLNALIRALTRSDQEVPAIGAMPVDPGALVELLRPIRYIGVASQAETQGVRTEAFVAIQDLR